MERLIGDRLEPCDIPAITSKAVKVLDSARTPEHCHSALRYSELATGLIKGHLKALRWWPEVVDVSVHLGMILNAQFRVEKRMVAFLMQE